MLLFLKTALGFCGTLTCVWNLKVNVFHSVGHWVKDERFSSLSSKFIFFSVFK